MKYIKLIISCHSEKSRELSIVGIEMDTEDPESIEWREGAINTQHIVDLLPSLIDDVVVITTTTGVINAMGTVDSVLELIEKA